MESNTLIILIISMVIIFIVGFFLLYIFYFSKSDKQKKQEQKDTKKSVDKENAKKTTKQKDDMNTKETTNVDHDLSKCFEKIRTFEGGSGFITLKKDDANKFQNIDKITIKNASSTNGNDTGNRKQGINQLKLKKPSFKVKKITESGLRNDNFRILHLDTNVNFPHSMFLEICL